MKFTFFFLILFSIIPKEEAKKLNDCFKKYFNGPNVNSYVCVCNSTYCDTIESIDDKDKSDLFQEFITSRDTYRLDKFKFKFENQTTKDNVLRFTINRSVKFQSIIGFGGAITDSAGYNINKLSDDTIKNILKSYFDDTGIQYGILRVPIGGVDFSLRPYTYADIPNDFNLTNFKLDIEDIKWKIPFIQNALQMSKKKIKFFASAWTAPPWMKTNNDYSGNGTLIEPVGGLYYQTWANYYLKFFQEYKKYNISFWAMTAQNEPTDGYLYKFGFNAMGFTPQTQALFILKNLGPTLAKNGFDNIKIMILDDQRLFLPGWPQQMFDYEPDAFKYISGIAVHWYLDFVVPPKQLDLTHKAFPNLFILGTEGCAGAGLKPHVILGGFDRALNYAKYIIQDLNHWVTGWTDWNIALDLNGGPNWANNFVDSPLIINSIADEFYRQPMFYSMGHFSKFIQENSFRIDTLFSGNIPSNLKSKISYVTLVNEELRQTTFIILNESDQDFNYTIFDPDINKFLNSVSTAYSIKTVVWFF